MMMMKIIIIIIIIFIYLLQLGCCPVAMVLVSIHKIPVMRNVWKNNSIMRHCFFY